MKQFYITDNCANNKCNIRTARLVGYKDVDTKVHCDKCKKGGE